MRIISLTLALCVVYVAPLRGQVPTWRATPAMTLGAGQADPTYRIAFATDAKRLANGDIVVSLLDEARLYDSSGKYVRSMTESGSPSGRMQDIKHLQLWRGDSIAVFHRNTRDFFTSAGDFGRSEAVHQLIGMENLPLKPTEHGSLPTDRVLVSGETLGHYADFTATGQWGLTHQYLLTVPDGALALTEIPAMKLQHNGEPGDPRKPFESVPFAAPPLVAASNDLIFIATASKPEIMVFGTDGKLVRTISLDRRAVAVTAADVEAYNEAMIAYEKPESRERRRAQLSRLTPEKQMPFFSQMVAARDGNIWVSDYTNLSAATAGWSVITPEGREIARVVLPRRFMPRDIGADFVLGTTSPSTAGAGVSIDMFTLSH